MSTVADPLTTALADTRQRTFDLIAPLSEETLEAVHSTLLSPLVWDLGHIAAFEDLWIARTFGLELLEPELISVYDADETPRAKRGDLPFLRTPEARDYMRRARERTLSTLEAQSEQDADHVEQRLELIVRHELQHNETMLQTLQIAGLPTGLGQALVGPAGGEDSGLELVRIPGGEVPIGAPEQVGFAYDNERPEHTVELGPYLIGRSPVSNGAWLAFIEDGGYRRRELWSEDGWTWRQAENVQAPMYWGPEATVRRFDRVAPIDHTQPVCHVSLFEAEAFMHHHGLRLPTEFEWEAAAQRDLTGMQGSVWQWTASEFHAYPGFRADPYPEYSEQFFGHGYRVLRGGAWLSSARVATVPFRNWDHPQRRQIFSGLRLAGDL